MELTWERIRLLFMHEWRLGENASEAARKINRAWGDDTVAERTSRKWFAKFKAGEDTLEDQPRSGRPKEVDRNAVLEHPPYSPDLAPSDYHLFRSMEHWLRDKKFNTDIELHNSVIGFFNSKDPDFYARGIDLLPEKWQEVIDVEGEYFDY